MRELRFPGKALSNAARASYVFLRLLSPYMGKYFLTDESDRVRSRSRSVSPAGFADSVDLIKAIPSAVMLPAFRLFISDS